MSDLSLDDGLGSLPSGEGGIDKSSYPPGEVIFLQGEAVSSLNIVLSGKVKLIHEENKHFELVGVKKSKDFLDESEIFQNKKRSYTAIAMDPTDIVSVKASDIRKIVKRCPDWVGVIMMTLSERLFHSIEMMKEHKILDEWIPGGKILPAEEKIIMEAIADYKRSKR